MTDQEQGREEGGEIITWDGHGRPVVPELPIIAFIEGDGIGPDIWAATRPVMDKAVNKAYDGKRKIIWQEILIGEKAGRVYGSKKIMPEESLNSLKHYGIALKGPLTNPRRRRFPVSKCVLKTASGPLCLLSPGHLSSRGAGAGKPA